ncbi:MAG: hypothetical protein M1827_007032 [Pycnora praestabilis]|nr:MAG: hypothetical protein M1827_007032 [Pycnora praestabilis]
MVVDTVVHSLSSLYKFTEEGQKEIIKRFESTSKAIGTTCSYDPIHGTFLLRCPREVGEATFSTLFDIFDRFIREETALEVEEPRVERDELTQLDRPPTTWEDLEESEVEESQGNLLPQRHVYEASFEEIWTPTGPQTDFLAITDHGAMSILKDLTACMFHIDIKERQIRVLGLDRASVDNAIAKLVNLERNSLHQSQYPICLHLVEVEADPDSVLLLCPLRRFARKMLQTTMLEPESQFTSQLPQMFVARLLKFDPSVERMLLPKQNLKPMNVDDNTLTSRIWGNYIFIAAGDESLNPLNARERGFSLSTVHEERLLNPSLPLEVVQRIEEWVPDGAAELEDPNTAVHTQVSPGRNEVVLESERLSSRMTGANSPTPSRTASPKSSKVSPRKKYGKIRRPRPRQVAHGTNNPRPSRTLGRAPSNIEQSLPSSLASHPGSPTSLQSSFTHDDPVVHDTATNTLNPSRSEETFLNHYQVSLFEERFDNPLFTFQATTSIIPDLVGLAHGDNEALVDVSSSSHHADHKNVSSNTILEMNPEDPSGEDTSLLDHTDDWAAPSGLSNLPALAPHPNDAVAMTAETGSHPKSSTIHARESTSGTNSLGTSLEESRAGSLGRPRDAIQATIELDSRVYRKTMGQQKAAGGSAKHLLDSSNLKKLNRTGLEILNAGRSFNGELKLEVNLGRILMSTIPKQYRKIEFSVEDWGKVFSRTSGDQSPNAIFTKMLTTSFADAEFILDLKLAKSARFSVKAPYEYSVTYELHCMTKEDKEIVIEIDESKDYLVKENPSAIGYIYCHYPKSWDAVITLTGTPIITNTHEAAVQSIVDNLFIPPNLNQLDISTRVDTKDLRIQSVVLRRRTHYKIPHHDTVDLRLTEVQKLHIQHLVNPPGAVRATAKSPSEMIADGRLWHEVALFSSVAEEHFKENYRLELGDEAKWNPEQLVTDGLLEGLMSGANDVVTRIDAVGYHNKGPYQGLSEMSTRQNSVAGGGEALNSFW